MCGLDDDVKPWLSRWRTQGDNEVIRGTSRREGDAAHELYRVPKIFKNTYTQWLLSTRAVRHFPIRGWLYVELYFRFINTTASESFI